jgi:hypothetical protein
LLPHVDDDLAFGMPLLDEIQSLLG